MRNCKRLERPSSKSMSTLKTSPSWNLNAALEKEKAQTASNHNTEIRTLEARIAMLEHEQQQKKKKEESAFAALKDRNAELVKACWECLNRITALEEDIEKEKAARNMAQKKLDDVTTFSKAMQNHCVKIIKSCAELTKFFCTMQSGTEEPVIKEDNGKDRSRSKLEVIFGSKYSFAPPIPWDGGYQGIKLSLLLVIPA